MVWFKVDDGFYSSRKVLSIPRAQRLAAVGLWTLAGNWSAKELTDGRIEEYVLAELGATPKLRQALVKARLWLDHGRDGVEFANWAEYQPSRAEVEAERAKAAERQRKWRDRHKEVTDDESVSHGVSNGVTNGVTNDVSHGAPTRPDPTRPKDSSPKSPSAAKRGTRISPSFTVTDAMREWARVTVPLVDIDKKLPEFIDFWKGVPGDRGVKLDWEATWHNGMRKQQQWAERDGLAPSSASRKKFNDVD